MDVVVGRDLRQSRWLEPLVSYHQIKRPIDWDQQFQSSAPLDVEIGFGLGEFLIRNAQENPSRRHVGIEQHWERIYKTLKRIALMKSRAGQTGLLENIRILRIDARIAFERLFLPQTIENIFCLFPCPWPKKGHVKHRLFSKEFLKLFNSRLKPGGRIKIVTDFAPYTAWIAGQLAETGFDATMHLTTPVYGTKFERKWRAEGKDRFYEILLTKRKHQVVAVKEDVVLKSHNLKRFTPEKFCFRDQTGETAVIFKELLYDPDKKKALVHLLVAEEHLTQHFWVAVIKKQKVWRVCKADGQSILPTPGTARAIDLVYEAAHGA